MRKLFLLLACSFSLGLYSQAEEKQDPPPIFYPEERWQIGFSPFALSINILKLELHRKVRDGHYVGLQGGPLVGDVNISGDPEDPQYRPMSGAFAKAIHKVYFPMDNERVATYVEHGFFYQYAATQYPTMDWITYEEDGVEFLRYGEVEKDHTSQRIGYDISFGVEFRLDFFYTNLSMGLGYVSKLRRTEAPDQFGFDNMIGGIDYQGIRLLPALKIGYLIR